ncbi:MAG: M3 family oligoendopeptidase [Chlamydiae bacterium]|nr:M3 family oligoendopeptidase [Chlamydiota bacterium]
MHDFPSFLQTLMPELAWKSKQVNQASWLMETTGSPDAADLQAELSQELRLLLHDPKVFSKLVLWKKETPHLSPLLQRQLEVLIRLYTPHQISKELIQTIAKQEADLSLLYTQFRAKLGDKVLSENDLRSLLRKKQDLPLRKKAWEASKQVGHKLAEPILTLVRLRNQAARSLGYSDFFQMQLALQEVEPASLFFLLEEVAALSQTAHDLVIQEIEEHQQKRFGVSVQELGPWLWQDPFAQEDPLEGVSLDTYLEKVDFCALSKQLFAQMGMDVTSILQASDLWEREKKNQHAFCINIDRQSDIRTLGNLTPTMKWLETLLHELGHAIYEQGFDQDLPWLLREPPHMISTEAMALLAGRKAYQSEVLHLILPNNTPLIQLSEQSLRRRQLLFSRFVLVMTYFEQELYRNPEQDLSTLWWDLVHTYQKISPPQGRGKEYDWAAKYHIGLAPAYYYSYLLGELFASQIEDTLHRSTGSALLFHQQAGAHLKEKLFAPGNRMSWSSLVEHVTGEPLGAKAWIRQFTNPSSVTCSS